MSLLSIYLFVYLFVCLFNHLQSLFFLVENVKQQEIRKSDLINIAWEIGRKRYRLGRVLGIHDGDLERIMNDYHGDILEQSYQILITWLKMKGSHATYSALAEALLDRTVDLTGVKEKFCLEN